MNGSAAHLALLQNGANHARCHSEARTLRRLIESFIMIRSRRSPRFRETMCRTHFPRMCTGGYRAPVTAREREIPAAGKIMAGPFGSVDLRSRLDLWCVLLDLAVMDRDILTAVVVEPGDPAVLDSDKLTAVVVEPDQGVLAAERNDHGLAGLLIRAGDHDREPEVIVHVEPTAGISVTEFVAGLYVADLMGIVLPDRVITV